MTKFVKKVNYVWEQRKFAELAEYKKGPFGSAITKSMFVPKSDDSVKVYEQQNAINKDWSLERYFLPKEYAYTRLKAFEVHSGDIIVSCAGTIGEIYEIPDNAEYGVINQALMRVRVYEKIVDKRMFIIAFSNMINEFTRTHSNGSAIKNIPPFADLKPMKVLMPSMEEQRVISECFEKIDYLITLHQRKIYIFIKKMPIDWEQRKLGEICSRVQGNDGRMELPTLTISAANGWMKQEDRFSGNIAGKEQKNYTLLHKGELSYNHGNSKLAKYGTVFSLQTYEEALVPRVYHSFKVEIGSADFIEYYFATKMPDRELRKLISSGARMDGLLNIGYDDFMGIKMMFPSVLEQDKIAECFRAFDHLITLHHRECVILRKTKVNDWEQRKLGELAEIVGGGTPSTSVDSYWDGDIDWYAPAEIGEQIYLESSQRKITEEGLTKSSAKILPIGTVLFTSRAGIGKTAILLKEGCTNQGFQSIVPNKEKLDSYFIFTRSEELKRYGETVGAGSTFVEVSGKQMANMELMMPKTMPEQQQIGEYFANLDHLITLHHRKCVILPKKKVNDWEQRKLGKVADIGTGKLDANAMNETGEYDFYTSGIQKYKIDVPAFEGPAITIAGNGATVGYMHLANGKFNAYQRTYVLSAFQANREFLFYEIGNKLPKKISQEARTGNIPYIVMDMLTDLQLSIPCEQEQRKLGEFMMSLDHLITLHHHEEFCTENVLIYIEINITIQIKEDIMAELESVIEQKLIDQLVYGDSQWTYRADLKTEEDLWNNFRYILEQNNKDRLNGEPLSDTEFEQVKNQLQFSSFYKAGEWLVGENGKVMVHVQRDTERLHLVVMNHEHIAGGSSVYEVINQYRALADEESQTKAQDRRFDVTLMINGLPMIHIELKNKQHSYMDGFWQIKKYIGEGKFTGIFSAVQMFVISNGVDTKYFSAASDTELNPKFISGWLDNENNPVPDYLDFAKSVLRIPEAHEMIARYTVLDEEAKRLILLRPYQIHAIEAIREASKTGKSGFVWHTTGSGKTLTSYKATRNLLMDIPSIDKAIFLIDRKDLDTQTSMAFQTYANNDLVDVDKTDNVFDLKKKLKSDDRQMIVTTIQKLQRLITKKLAEGTPEYNKIKSLKIAFVVDECHRAVTPGTKRELERFFANSLWYGFTGTPRFAENPYPQLGDLPRTTEELYGERLHRYTIQNAIHDNAVLGFQVEHNGPKNMDDETDSSMYENETHMLRVLDVILNKSYHKLGFQNGKGKTYEGLLTTGSIQLAQKYYELLKRVKNGETELQIDEKVKQILPDFPKFAITYSVTENEEGSHLNQEKMKESIKDYNEMFGTKLDISQIQSYNANLNKRLARNEP